MSVSQYASSTSGTNIPNTVFNGITTYYYCSNSSPLTFGILLSNFSSFASYSINWGNGQTSNGTPSASPITKTYTTAGVYFVTLNTTDANGCTSVKQFNLFFGTNPSAGLSSSGNTTGCIPPDSTGVSFDFIINNWQTDPIGILYKFSLNSASIPTVTIPSPLVNPITGVTAHPNLRYDLATGVLTYRHRFTQTSCGLTYQAGPLVLNNVYFFALAKESPCGTTYSSIGPIDISTMPQAAVNAPSSICVGNSASFTDASIGGQVVIQNNGVYTCNNASSGVWRIVNTSGYTLTSGSTGTLGTGGNRLVPAFWTAGSSSITLNFTTPGTYTVIRYIGLSNSAAQLCGIDSVLSTITVHALPIAPTANNISVCQGSSPILPTVSSLTGLTARWYTSATGGASSASPATYSTATTGIIQRWVSYYDAATGCEGPRTLVTITVLARPDAPVAPSRTYCIGDVATPLTATASPTTFDLLWYTAATGGTASSTAPTPSTATLGTTSYWVSQKNPTTLCESQRTLVTVTVVALPSAPTAPNPSVCFGTALTLSATVSAGNTAVWYTQATGGTGTTVAPNLPATTAAGTYTYYVSQRTSSNCEGPRDTLTVTVNPLPQKPQANDLVLCQNDPVQTLSVTAVTGLTPRWYTSATTGTSTATPAVYVTSTATTLLRYVSFFNAATNCEGPRDTLTILINPQPDAPVAPSRTYCIGDVATPLTATASPTTFDLLWYTAATGGTGSSTAPTPLTATLGTTSYWVSQKNPTTLCESQRTLVTVTVNNVPVAPTAPAVEYCLNASAVPLTATPSAGATLKWYNSALVVLANAPTPSTSAAGVQTFYVSQTFNGNGCEGPRTLITVTVHALPTAPVVTAPAAYCQGDTASALVATPATGNTLRWYTTATGGTFTATAPTPSTNASGTFNWWVSQVNPTTGCEGPRASISVTVNPTPATPTVVNRQYCLGDPTVSVVATPLANQNLEWYSDSLGATTFASAPVPSSAAVDTFTYFVRQVNNLTGCASPRIRLTVVINPLPAAPSVDTTRLCLSQAPVPLSVSHPTGTTLEWFDSDTNLLGSSVTASALNVDTVLYWVRTIQTTTLCESPLSPHYVIVAAIPGVPVAGDTALCQGQQALPLYAYDTTGSNVQIRWYLQAAGGTPISGPPTPSTLQAGVFTYYVCLAVPLSSCEGVRVPVQVTVLPQPPMPLANDTSYCTSPSPVGGPLRATALPNHTLLWYTLPAGGIGATLPPVPNTTITGTFTYFVTQTGPNGCESARKPVVVTINPLTGPTVQTPVFYCVNDGPSPLQATASGPNTLRWYTVATGGSFFTTAPTPSTANSGVTSYWVSQVSPVQGCESNRVRIDVNVQPTPPTPQVLSVTYCQGDTASPVIGVPTPGHTLSWHLTSIGGTSSSQAFIPSTLTPGSYVFWAAQTNDSTGCSSPRVPLTIVVNPKPNVPVPLSVQYCAGSVPSVLTANAMPNHSLVWYTSLTDTLGLTTPPGPSTATPGVTTYYVAQINSSGCMSDRVPLTVTIYPLPPAPTAQSLAYCLNDVATPIQAQPVFGNSLRWYTTPTGGTPLATAPTPSTATPGAQYYWVSQFDANTCESPRSVLQVYVYPLPPAPITNPVVYCQGDLASSLTAQVLPGHTSRWYSGPSGGIGVTFGPVPSTGTAGTFSYYVSQVSTATGCEGPRAALSITVNPKPTARWSAQLTDGDSCSIPKTYLFNNTSTGSTSQTWNLYFGGALLQSDSTFSFSRRFSTSGRFTLELIVRNNFGCEDTLTQELKINSGIQSTLVASPKEGCEPLQVVFDLNQSYNNDLDSLYRVTFYAGNGFIAQLPLSDAYTWTYTYPRFGTYIPFVVTEMFSRCTDSAYSDTIRVFLTPNADFTSSYVNYRTLAFQNLSTDTTSSSQYLWSFGDGTTSTQFAPVHEYDPEILGKDSIEICLWIVNDFGCDDTLCVNKWIWPAQLHVPNAFAPELSYVEDDNLFAPKGHSLMAYDLKIYDKWGSVVYSTNALDADGNPSEPWNGRVFNTGELLPMGAYVWTIEATYNDGTLWPGQENKFGESRRFGTVMLLR